MATNYKLHVLTPSTSCSTHLLQTRYLVPRKGVRGRRPSALQIRCSIPVTYDPTIPRRSEHYQYQPTIWDYDFVESLESSFAGGTYTNQTEKLKEKVRLMLKNTSGQIAKLELIDTLERLGVGYLFEGEIKKSLEDIDHNKNKWTKDSLYATALTFRILRQHGYKESAGVFKEFQDEKGSFKDSLTSDIKGLLSLYEATHVVYDGEKILDTAREFTRKHLKGLEGNVDTNLAKQVNRSLEIPLHWRMARAEARWYMDIYEKDEGMNPALLELAKLDFNMVQAVLQKDLRSMSRWWRNLGVAAKLTFARDRLVESFLWSVGIAYEPDYELCREWLTKVMNFVLIIDDIYDVYGSLEELELFTDAVERWDHKLMNNLPYYMKVCFLALYNTTNEMAYEILKEQGWDILPYLTKSWANFIKAMLQEAKWCKQGYTPSLKEYLDNGWLSSSGSVFLVHAFFATKQKIKPEVLEGLDKNHQLLKYSSMMFRLSNDLATSSAELERGDVASSIFCYMRETNASEAEARNYIRELILDSWKKLNISISESPFELPFINMGLNLARSSLFIYQYGDGLGVEDSKSKEHILSLIVNPVEN
ncbi:hypothetical protein Syun_010317 [Stephania yunnanensis]|uniref:Uncharacterized protein n=1 Tax=Stephania yunnanensis TaxID=152371 RepID=A0AAP0KGA5_9MAGN